MVVLVSLIVSLKRFVSTIFLMVHPIPTSPFIHLNGFCTCSTYLCGFAQLRACIGSRFPDFHIPDPDGPF